MKQPIISNLEHVTKKMIDALETWLKNVKSGKWQGDDTCPFREAEGTCNLLFENLSMIRCKKCPCFTYGKAETVLAFEIIIDVFKEYYGNKKKKNIKP
jgi:hypothetical protein